MVLKEHNFKVRLLFYFTIGYLTIFSLISIYILNLEFIFYTFIIAILVFITLKYYKTMNLTYPILVGLSIAGLLHVLGGNLYIGETRLYDYWIIQDFFKFDNLVHLFASGVALFVAYGFLKPHLGGKLREDHPRFNRFLLYIILVLMTMGMGALVEVIELFAVLLFDVSHMVGDYMNNALDLLFNLIGSIIAVIILSYYHKKQFLKKENEK